MWDETGRLYRFARSFLSFLYLEKYTVDRDGYYRVPALSYKYGCLYTYLFYHDMYRLLCINSNPAGHKNTVNILFKPGHIQTDGFTD